MSTSAQTVRFTDLFGTGGNNDFHALNAHKYFSARFVVGAVVFSALMSLEQISHRSRQRPLFIAWGLFAVSMFLPASDGFYGWQCAAICATIFRVTPLQLAHFYYFLFTVANAVMLLSVPLVFSRKKIAPWMVAGVAGSLLYVFSFLVVARSGNFSLCIGYYVWLASFFVLTGAVLWLTKRSRALVIPSVAAG